MDLDLVTNASTINSNIILLNNGKISWVIFGYVNNKTLNVVETGENNFEDMFEEFDANKIMYGLLAVIDQNSKLRKNVFIFWQGKAASESMKSASVQHSNVIRNLFKPIHVTLNARDEQDLDLKEIMDKVASASGSNYSTHIETKSIYESQPSVKSEENTAVNMRRNRLKDLSSLGSIQKEPVQNERIGSRYEKINPTEDIKTLRNSMSGPTVLPKRVKAPNYDEVDAAKDITPSRTSCQSLSNTRFSYKKINPEEELKSINMKQKILFENKILVKGEDNTAQNAKEERQKELSSLFSKRISCTDETDSKVGTNYTKVNPQEEIKKYRQSFISENETVCPSATETKYTKINPQEDILMLRRASLTTENEDLSFTISSTYKKINPNEEMQMIRRSTLTENEEPISPGSNYKKTNPAEEIRKLKSQNSFVDEGQIKFGFDKVNAMEEINIARRLSIESPKHYSDGSSNSNVSSPIVVKPSLLSARKSIDLAHKGNNDIQQPHRFSKQHAFHEDEDTSNFEDPKLCSKTVVRNQPIKASKIDIPTKISHQTPNAEIVPKNQKIILEKESVKEINAIAQFKYNTAEPDEISFEEDELIRDIETIDMAWWVGTNANGQRGMFPSNYVKLNDIVTHKANEKPTPVNSSVTVRALFDYVSDGMDDISFNEGDMIYNVIMSDEMWWEGEVDGGKRGMFPANYVEKLLLPN